MKRDSGRRPLGRRVGGGRPLTTAAKVVVVLMVFSLGVLGPLGRPVHASPFADVPAGHWTYSALEQLSAADLIDGYPPGFFSGARRLTRYEMALSLAGALERLASRHGAGTPAADEEPLAELIGRYNVANPKQALRPGDSELLRAGVVEFKPELEVLGYKVPATEPWRAEHSVLRLDASIGVVARGLLQKATEPQDRWSVGPGTNAGERRAFSSSVNASHLRAGTGKGRLVDLQTGTAIARIGSTILYVGEHERWAQELARIPAPIPALDGTIHLTGHLLPGTGITLMDPDDPEAEPLPLWQVTETWGGVDGVVVAPNVSLSGEQARRTSAQGETGATQVHAKVLMGDVSIDGKLRRVEPGFVPAFQQGGGDGGDAMGVGLTLRLGDVFVSTGRDIVHRSADMDPERVTSLTLEYSLAEAGSFRAGWQSVSDTRERTSVDVNVPVPQGALHLGLAYEGAREPEGAGISMTTLTMAGLDLRLRENAEARAAFSVRDSALASERTTSLGLRYTLSAEAAVLLGYKLIDFAVDHDRQNVTTAEFSIRF